MEAVKEQVALRGPAVLTAVAVVLVIGYGLGAFAAISKPTPTIVQASISADGSVCSVQFENQGGTDVRLSILSLAYSTPSARGWAVSFPKGLTIVHDQVTTYSCLLGTTNQFLPSASGLSGEQYNLTAKYDDGTSVSFSAKFS
jgi:hypothetical protein